MQAEFLRPSIHAAVLLRAVQLLGNTDTVAARLGVSAARVEAWLGGFSVPSDEIFLRVVDLLAECEGPAPRP